MAVEPEPNVSQSAAPPPETISLSPSVASTLQTFPDSTPVRAWTLVQNLLSIHPEYGNFLAKKVAEEPGPPGGMTRSASAWQQDVAARFDPAKVAEIHGRLFILGLCEVDAELARYLDSFGLRAEIKSELREPYETLLRALADSAPSPIAPRKAWLYMADASDPAQLNVLQERDSVLWGANPNTRAGDLVFMYLTRPETRIAYIFQALEEAQDASELRHSNPNWKWDYSVRLGNKIQLSNPVPWDEIRNEPTLNGWSLQRNVQGAMRRKLDIGEEGYYPALRTLIVRKNPDIQPQLSALETGGVISSPNFIVFRADAPTALDQLGRQGFADALTRWLTQIWADNYRQYVARLAALTPAERLLKGGSFVVHLHGPWGAGKTTLLKLMETTLRNTALTIGGRPRGWQIVWFNAWRNRHLEPVWWPLMDRVYRSAANTPGAPPDLRLWETWWRLRINGLGENPLVIGMGALTLLGLLVWGTGSGLGEGALALLTRWIGGVSTFLGLAGTLGTAILTLSRSLFSASSAQNFVRLAQDPMEKVQTHFRELMDKLNRPVIVFIDDLDRCQPEYVVRLLESIQTLFNDPRVVYVVAADRRWLYECFEIVYKDFKASVREPGRRTGYLFLEKIFQMSISVPAMSAEAQKAYLDRLYRGERAEAEQKAAAASQQAEAEFAQLNTTEALIEHLETPQPDADPLVLQARREAAVRRLASQEVSADIEHFLQPFAPLLERNPRAMKRLVNAYSIYLALALLVDTALINSAEKLKRFALWTILSLRWPALAEKLEQAPETLPAILQGDAASLDADLAALAREEDVQNVLHGRAENVGVALNIETITHLLGLQPSSRALVVA